MKTFYHIDNFTGTITELTPDDIINAICLMRTHGAKDGRFYETVQEYLIKKFWDWQCDHPEEVDPAFRIFDCIEDAQKSLSDDKFNQEIFESNFKDFLKD